MFQIYVGKVYNVQIEELEQAQLLSFFLKGGGVAVESKILVCEGESIKGCITYRDVLFHREIIYKQFVHSESVFEDALTFINEEEIEIEDGMCFPVVNELDELMYILEYRDINAFIAHRHFFLDEKDFKQFPRYLNYKVKDTGRLDLEILERADLFVFKEFNEYSYVVSQIIQDMTDKLVVFLDEKASLFYKEVNKRVKVMDDRYLDDYLISEKKRVLYVYKYDEWDFEKNYFGLINIFHAIFWRQNCMINSKEQCEYLVLDYAATKRPAGLIPQLRMYLSFRDYACQNGLQFVVKNTPFMMYEAHMLSKYFELGLTFSQEPIEYSRSIVVRDYIYWTGNYVIKKKYDNFMIDPEHHFTNYLKEILENYTNTILPSDKRVLGVLVRGTDYKIAYGHHKQADASTVIKRAETMMEYDGYDYVYLATEDQEVFDEFQKHFGERLLYVDQHRYSNKKFVDGIKVIAQLSIKEEEESRMLDYVKVLYVLSKCTSLLASGNSSGVQAAKMWNKEQYEEVYVYDLGMNK